VPYLVIGTLVNTLQYCIVLAWSDIRITHRILD
jgi:hypothetical protein